MWKASLPWKAERKVVRTSGAVLRRQLIYSGCEACLLSGTSPIVRETNKYPHSNDKEEAISRLFTVHVTSHFLVFFNSGNGRLDYLGLTPPLPPPGTQTQTRKTTKENPQLGRSVGRSVARFMGAGAGAGQTCRQGPWPWSRRRRPTCAGPGISASVRVQI